VRVRAQVAALQAAEEQHQQLAREEEEQPQPAGQQLVKVRAQVAALQAAEEQHLLNKSSILTTKRKTCCMLAPLIFCSVHDF
jgi:hypothetical protein